MFNCSTLLPVFTNTNVRPLSHLVCVRDTVFLDQFRTSAVQRYVHDLMFEIGGHLDEITAALTIFIEIGGLPTGVRCVLHIH